MIPEGEDGVDFINIYSKSKTKLGRWLSNFARSPIELPDHGHFESIEGYWYWLGTRDEKLRQLVGFAAKQYGRSLRTDSEIEDVPEFDDYIRSAIDTKLRSNRTMLLALAQSTLPLVHFYEYQGKRVDAGYEWIVEHIAERRRILQENGWGQ